MNRALIRKSVGEARLLLLSSAVVMFAFCWVRVWIISLLPTDRFKTIVEQFREFERFLPVPLEQLFTYPGRIALTYDELIVVMCVVIWAIARGSDAVAGELERGTMEVLLAQPVSRLKVLVTQSVVTVLGVAVLALASWLGVYAGIQTTWVDEPVGPPPLIWPMLGMASPEQLLAGETRAVPMASKVDAADMWPAAVNLFALGFFIAGLSTLFSSIDRYRWRTIGVVAAIYVVQLIMKIVGLASESLHWLLKLTFFTAYNPERFVSVAVHTPTAAWRVVLVDDAGDWVALAPLGYDLLLIGIGLAMYVAAAWIFCRRDLPAPV
ncbi:MAG: ABC transporter permease subunit [Pirellulaceae bacterium]